MLIHLKNTVSLNMGVSNLIHKGLVWQQDFVPNKQEQTNLSKQKESDVFLIVWNKALQLCWCLIALEMVFRKWTDHKQQTNSKLGLPDFGCPTFLDHITGICLQVEICSLQKPENNETDEENNCLSIQCLKNRSSTE